MKKFSHIFTIFVIALNTFSCALLERKIVEPLDYLDNSVKLDIKKFFDGSLDAFAIKQDAQGKITGTSTAKITAKWDENKGTIQQNFIYQDGKKDNRTWFITVNSDGTFDAVGHDVSVPAQGKQIGNAAQSNYSLTNSQKGVREEISFEDRMYLVDDKSMIMISAFSVKNPLPNDKNSSGRTIVSLKKTSN